MKRYSVNIRSGSTYVICGQIKFTSKKTAENVCKQFNTPAFPGMTRPLRDDWEAVIEEIIVDRDDAEQELEDLQHEVEISFPQEE